MKKLKPETAALHAECAPGDRYRPSSTPLYQTATFRQESLDDFGEYDYSRSGNPTRTVLEARLAELEHARHGFAFSSGMAAISTVLRLLKSGEGVLGAGDLYGGTFRLFEKICARQGIRTAYADASDLESFDAVLRKHRPRLVWIETPSNPRLRITDLRSLSALCRRAGAWLAVDNTFLSPVLQNPLFLGADLVIHSATKHLGGHSDVTAGAICLNSDELASEIRFIQNAEGSALAPFDSWLLLRGLKTLHLRVRQQQKNAQKLAQYLEHSRTLFGVLKAVHYPGLDQFPDWDLHFSQASGAGTVIGIETGSLPLSLELARCLKLFPVSVSFGGLQSSLCLPNRMSHASTPETIRSLDPIPADWLRLSVGIEDAEDLIGDFSHALERTAEIASQTAPGANLRICSM